MWYMSVLAASMRPRQIAAEFPQKRLKILLRFSALQ